MLKKLFKYRSFDLGRLQICLFQDNRIELGIALDWYEWPLLSINFIFIHFEFNLMGIKEYREWKYPSKEELNRIEAIRNLSNEEKANLVARNLMKDLFKKDE